MPSQVCDAGPDVCFTAAHSTDSCSLINQFRARWTDTEERRYEREEKNKNWIGGHVYTFHFLISSSINETRQSKIPAARLDARGSVGVKVSRVEIHNILIIKIFQFI